MQIDVVKDQLFEKTTDTARPFLSLTNLKKTLIPLAPLNEQREIVRRIEAAFARIDRMAAEAARAAALLDRLEQATLAKAFCGELLGEDVPEVVEAVE
jgi:type I restriction enzyme S subunit